MAQLNSLIVTGPSRFLNKLMVTEIQATQLNVADKLSVTSSVFTYNGRKVMTGSSVGNSTTPVYIDANGYPVAISSYSGTSAVANKLGTATVGSGTKFIYLNGGTATASSSTIGASNKGVYLNSGTVTAMTYALNATINAGAANKLAYYSGANAISQYTSTVGTATKGVYMSAGWPTAMTYELKATLNNATQWGVAYYSTATNVTSTAAGTAGYLLQGNGAAAPSWIQATNANTANTIVKRDGSGNFSAGTITASLNGNAKTATNADTVDGYHIGEAEWKYSNTYDQPTAGEVWYLKIQTPDYSGDSETIYLRGIGNNRRGTVILKTGSRHSAWWGYSTSYNGTNIIGVKKVVSASDDVYIKMDASCTQVTIKTTFSPRISASTDTTGYTNVPSNGGLFGNSITVGTIYGALSGNASSASKVNNALTINGKTYNGSAAVNVGTIGTAYGGTGVTTHTANRLVWSTSATTIQAGNHYAAADKVAINSTSAPSDNFYVNGTSHFNGDTRISGNILMSNSNSAIYWDNSTYRQRIVNTDDATADTAVFTFQQSSDSGSNWSTLLTIKDNGKLIVPHDIIANKSIRNLEIGGGIYWNPYVESASDNSDAASITVIKSGCAGGTELRISQMNDSNDVINLVTNKYIYLNGKKAFSIQDNWLRINDEKGFSTGIYTGSSLVRSDSQFQVGNNGANFYANSSGNGYFSNTLGIAGTNTGYKLYVNGTSWIKGNLSTRHLYPEADSTYDIGSTTYHWRYGYFDGLYISSNTSYSAWNSAANGVFINTDNFGIQRTSAGGGFYVYSNGAQVARMYLDTIGTAGDGTNAGALGSARLILGNSTARSSTSGTGANNARGILQIYSQSNRLGVEIWGDNEGGNIQIYSPSQTYYTNASNATAAHFWQIDSHNGNLRFYNYYGGSSTAASAYRGIYIERTGTIFPNDNNIQNLGTSSKYWANAYITTINGTTFTGNAASATKLATARTLTIGNTGKSFNGTADVSWSRDEIGCSYDHYTTWDFTKAYSSNYVTFDMQKPSGGPGGWINAFVSTHDNYLSSFIANVHRSGDWYVGWSEHSSTANVNPTWYKLLHTGNYTSTLDSRYILKSGDTMTGTINSMDIIPKADNTYTLGTSTNRWKEIFGYTLTAYTKLQAGSSYLNSSNDLYIARSVGIKVAPDTNYALKVTDNSYFNGHLILADNKFIRRNGRSVSWIQGRDGAILRQTTYTGYNPIISAKTTDGDWSFGPSGSNIMYLTYCTDANYNAGTNTTTAQFLFKPDGTMYIGSNKVLDSSMFSLSGTTLTITI